MKRLVVILTAVALVGFVAVSQVYVDVGFGLPFYGEAVPSMTLGVGFTHPIVVDVFRAEADFHYLFPVAGEGGISTWYSTFGVRLGTSEEYLKLGFAYHDYTGWWFILGFRLGFELPLRIYIGTP